MHHPRVEGEGCYGWVGVVYGGDMFLRVLLGFVLCVSVIGKVLWWGEGVVCRVCFCSCLGQSIG